MTSDKLADAVRVARCYYLQGMTMEAIAHDMNTSRSTISRLLSVARAEGIIEFRLRALDAPASDLERKIGAAYHVRPHVVPVPQRATEQEILEQVVRTAAWVLDGLFNSGMVLGVAWGRTISAVSDHLQRKPTRGSEIVQLNGAGNTTSTGIKYASEILDRFGRAFDARVQQFPVPTFFDYPATRAALWRERSITRILDLQARADVLLFGVGDVARHGKAAGAGDISSHVYAGGYLEPEDYQEMLALGVVGDVATFFVREDGTYDGIPLNERSSVPPPEVLRRAPRRLCVVAGANRARGLKGALLAGLVTDLVLDERTAEALIALARGALQAGTPLPGASQPGTPHSSPILHAVQPRAVKR
jgi:DNA-binding transcriptional regulator LsrR (DeoR family)